MNWLEVSNGRLFWLRDKGTGFVSTDSRVTLHLNCACLTYPTSDSMCWVDHMSPWGYRHPFVRNAVCSTETRLSCTHQLVKTTAIVSGLRITHLTMKGAIFCDVTPSSPLDIHISTIREKLLPLNPEGRRNTFS
jgi:hypothetical protein